MYCPVFLEFTKKKFSFAVEEPYGLSQSCDG